jgi:endonuclease YncB( thermonuclease family)
MADWRRHILIVFVVGFAAIGATARNGIAQQAATPPCGGVEIARATVGRIVDGRTFVLDDGREVRLAGVETPNMETAQATSAKDALVALAQGDEVALRRAEMASDRYGRIVAYAYTLRDGDEIFLQSEMIAAGLARVGDRVAGKTCAAELLNREHQARAAKLGLWADSDYDVVDAEALGDVMARRGRFALVEGQVASVRESGPTIYVNFGRRWSHAFTVTISKRKSVASWPRASIPKRWRAGASGSAAGSRSAIPAARRAESPGSKRRNRNRSNLRIEIETNKDVTCATGVRL